MWEWWKAGVVDKNKEAVASKLAVASYKEEGAPRCFPPRLSFWPKDFPENPAVASNLWHFLQVVPYLFF